MSARTLLAIAFLAFIVFGLARVFRKDTSDPNVVLDRYLSHWVTNNTTGMYPLLSGRAKQELKKEKVNNVADYYAFFVDRRPDLTNYSVTSKRVNEGNSRFWVTLKVLDYVGREFQENATFVLIRQPDGWRVDSWQRGGENLLP